MNTIELNVSGDDHVLEIARRAAAVSGIADQVSISGNCVPIIATRSDSLSDIVRRYKQAIRDANRKAREFDRRRGTDRRKSMRLHPEFAFRVMAKNVEKERRSGIDRRQNIVDFAEEINALLDQFIPEVSRAA